MVNEFSDFARMPKPLFKENNIIEIIKTNLELLKSSAKEIKVSLNTNINNPLLISCDNEQISRVFFNLLKNSIESIEEKSVKTGNFDKIISIEIKKRNDYIVVNIIDNGIGFTNKNAKDLIKPYFTTKQKGSGLGLSIVNKIINDHNGSLSFLDKKNGAKIQIVLPIK